MKTRWQYIVSLSAVFSAAGLLLGSCRSHPSVTIRTPDGIEVTARAYTKDSHLAKVLEAKAWKFHVTTPKRRGNYACMLEVRRKGKPAISLGGIGVGPDTEIVVVIEPGGTSFQHSSTLRIVRVLGEGTTYLRAIYPNPFKSSSTTISKVGEPLEAGAFALISGGQYGARAPHKGNDTVLVCIFRDMAKQQSALR